MSKPEFQWGPHANLHGSRNDLTGMAKQHAEPLPR